MPEPVDLYKVLQVDPEAEHEVVQAAYRRLARKYHPDLAPGPEAAARMASINAAWDRLGDPLERAAYDRERSVRDAWSAEAGWPGTTPGARPATPSTSAGRSDAAAPGPTARPPERCRATGPPDARTRAVATTTRCARRMATARRERHPARRRGASSTSAVTPAGHSARSPGETSSTSNGWTGHRSAGHTETRSTRSCGRPGDGVRSRRRLRTGEACSAVARSQALSPGRRRRRRDWST